MRFDFRFVRSKSLGQVLLKGHGTCFRVPTPVSVAPTDSPGVQSAQCASGGSVSSASSLGATSWLVFSFLAAKIGWLASLC